MFWVKIRMVARRKCADSHFCSNTSSHDDSVSYLDVDLASLAIVSFQVVPDQEIPKILQSTKAKSKNEGASSLHTFPLSTVLNLLLSYSVCYTGYNKPCTHDIHSLNLCYERIMSCWQYLLSDIMYFYLVISCIFDFTK